MKSSIVKSSESESRKEEPSPLPIKKSVESESFLASVVKSAQDLNIDLGSISATSISVEPEKKKKPDVTVARSHTVASPLEEKKKPKKTISHELPYQSVTSISTMSSEKSSNPAVLNPAQLQALQKMRGIKPKALTKTPTLPSKKIVKSATISEASSATTSPKVIKHEPIMQPATTIVEPTNVSVNYQMSNPYGTKVFT